MRSTIILGTRGSELALKQTAMVTALLEAAHPGILVERKIIQTAGDKRPDLRFSEFSKGDTAILDKGIFIKELEIALEKGEIHAAVHSLKDVPSALEPQFSIAAVLERAPIEDVLISAQPFTLDTLPKGARIGTSSVRRARQLQWLRPDLNIVELRGNVPTRIRKCLGENALDAILLAAAGVLRLDLLKLATSTIEIDGQTLHAEVLDPVKFMPAAGQGAIAIEVRSDDSESRACVRALNHDATEARVIAEREFLRLLGAGCQTPVGAHTTLSNGNLQMSVRVFSESGPPGAETYYQGGKLYMTAPVTSIDEPQEEPPQEYHAEAPLDQPLELAKQLSSLVIRH